MQEEKRHIKELEKRECDNENIVVPHKSGQAPVDKELLVVGQKRNSIEKGRCDKFHQEYVAQENDWPLFDDYFSHEPMVSHAQYLRPFDRKSKSSNTEVLTYPTSQRPYIGAARAAHSDTETFK